MCMECVKNGLMTEDELTKTEAVRKSIKNAMESEESALGVTTLSDTLSSALRNSDIADAMWRGVFSSMTRAGWKIGVMLNNDTGEVGIVWDSGDVSNDIIVMGVLPEPFAAALRPLVPGRAATKTD